MNQNELNVFFSGEFEYTLRYSKDQKFVKPIQKNDLCKEFKKLLNVNVELDSEGKYGDNEILDSLDSKQILSGFRWNLSLIVDNVYKYNISVLIKPLPLKGKAKALGLKSSFVKGNELVLTSFGQGNDARIEKKITDNDIAKIESAKPEHFSVNDITKEKIILSKGKNDALIDNPTNIKEDLGKNYRLDYLRKKDKLEKEFFNNTFDDNIHIQLIYNILDIKKILSLYIDDITYILCSAGRNDSLEDMMGGSIPYYVTFNNLYDDVKERFIKYFEEAKSYLTYYPSAFSQTVLSEKMLYETYDIFRVLSLCRQFVRHTNNKKTVSLYQLENESKDNFVIKGLVNVVKEKYNQAWQKLNAGFVKNAQKNIYIILKTLNISLDDTKKVKDVLNKYYGMVISKDNANRGFDFKKLKERVIDYVKLDIKPDDKSGAHQCINYIIHHIVTDDLVNKYVEKLRSCLGNEDKDLVYNDFANELKEEASKYLNNDFLELVRKVKVDKKTPNCCLDSMLEVSKSNTLFDKVIYFICIFLSPKDVNMLLSSLINKFSNINTFNNLIKELECTSSVNYSSEYEMFNESAQYVSKLNTVLNLVRIQKQFNKQSKNNKTKNIKTKNSIPTKEEKVSQKPLFFDVYNLFGFDYCRIDKTIEEFHKKVYETAVGKMGKKTKSLRNYLISNFINSNKFRYIVQYANPKDCYNIIQNEKIVKYVLNEMPKDQLIARAKKTNYYNESKDELINYFANELKDINIKYIYYNYDIDSERISTIAGLYLAVIYIVIKQLVRVNSYYSIAFSCLERDKALFEMKSNIIDLDLTTKFIYMNRFKPKVAKYLSENILECKTVLKDTAFVKKDGSQAWYSPLKKYRDKVVHVNIAQGIKKYLLDFLKNQKYPMRSYFELYNYLIQRMIIEECLNSYKTFLSGFEKPVELVYFSDNLQKYQTYDRDLLHIINMPFAYNLARYKNLTIEDVFYDNYKDKLKVKKGA